MDKKKLTSWGVSFSSLALVAGMVSYLGVTNKSASTANTTAQTQATGQNTVQQSQNGSSQNSTFSYTAPDQSGSSNNGFAVSQSHQHGGFSTTTGGS